MKEEEIRVDTTDTLFISLLRDPEYFLAEFRSLLSDHCSFVERYKEAIQAHKDDFYCSTLLSNIHELENELNEMHDIVIKSGMEDNFVMSYKPFEMGEHLNGEPTTKTQPINKGSALYKDVKGATWEKVVFRLPAEDETASYEFKVKLKGEKTWHPFSLKEFGFWNRKHNKSNRLWVSLKALGNIHKYLGKSPDKNELSKHRKTISDLRKLLKKQLGIEGDPFNKPKLNYASKFEVISYKTGYTTEFEDYKTSNVEDWKRERDIKDNSSIDTNL